MRRGAAQPKSPRGGTRGGGGPEVPDLTSAMAPATLIWAELAPGEAAGPEAPAVPAAAAATAPAAAAV